MAEKKEFKMSQAHYEALKKELAYLKTTRSEEVEEMIRVARGFGDLSENSEYTEATQEQGKVFSRINELENVLLYATVIDVSASDQPADQVTLGATVTVTAIASGVTRKLTILGSEESDPMKGIISEESPLGRALLGAQKGQVVTVSAPAGDMEYSVDEIER